jgi:hypothetical protein
MHISAIVVPKRQILVILNGISHRRSPGIENLCRKVSHGPTLCGVELDINSLLGVHAMHAVIH